MYGGIMTTSWYADPRSFDPHQEGSAALMNAIAGPAYNGLVRLDPSGSSKIVPDLAEAWDISPDGKVFTFRLRKGVLFHDGTPFTAEDAKFSLGRIKSPPKGMESPRKDYLSAVTGMEAPDAQTLKITLAYPQAGFISILADPWMVVVPKRVVETRGDMTRVVVGTGPFKFKEFLSGVSTAVVRNPNYFREGLPYLDGVTNYNIPDAGARFAALRTRQLLLIGPLPGLSLSEAEVLRRTATETVVMERGPHAMSRTTIPNTLRAPFDNVKVRQAIGYALNRKVATKVAGQGLGIVGGVLPPFWGWGLPAQELAQMPGYGPDEEADLAKAADLLKEAGVAQGLEIKFHVQKGSVDAEYGSVYVADRLSKVGIKVSIVLEDQATNFRRRTSRDFDILHLGAYATIPDPDQHLSTYYLSTSGYNLSSYKNPEIDELFAKQSRTLDTTERRKLLDEMQRAIMASSHMNVLYWGETISARAKEVRGWVRPYHHFLNTRMDEVWLAR